MKPWPRRTSRVSENDFWPAELVDLLVVTLVIILGKAIAVAS